MKNQLVNFTKMLLQTFGSRSQSTGIWGSYSDLGLLEKKPGKRFLLPFTFISYELIWHIYQRK